MNAVLAAAKAAALPSRWTLQEAHAQDDARLLQLFEQAFGQRMSLEHWRWKYGDAPMRGTLLLRADEPVAFYGGMPRAVQGPQRLHHAVQNGDVMVRPDERGVFTRRGALYHVGHAFITRHIGPGCDYEFGYGFPSARHFALGEKLGLYVNGGRMVRLRWPASASTRTPWLLREEQLREDGLAVLAPLWQAMRRDWHGLYLPVRDAARWRMRFLQRPGVDYTLLAVRRRFGGRPLAALALREHTEHVEWLDYVGGRDGVAVALAAARRFAARSGKPLVALGSQAIVPTLALDGPQQEDSGIVVPLRFPEPGWEQPYPWQGKLWLMAGDSDFM